MFAGSIFSSGDLDLEPPVRELDARLAALFPEFLDGSTSAHLRFRRDESSGRSVFLADGFRPAPGTALVLYYGHVADGRPAGDYVLARPSFRRDGRTWRLSVDAAVRYRTRYPLSNAALFNHCCLDATVVLHQQHR